MDHEPSRSEATTRMDAAMIPRVLRQVQMECMSGILRAWFEQARRQWRDAVQLLAVDSPDTARVRDAWDASVTTVHLIPVYWALAARFAGEVVGAPQPDLFGGDYESQLHAQWSRFAIDYMGEGGRPLALRMVLQATIGLQGSRDQQEAGRCLLDHVRDTSLGGW